MYDYDRFDYSVREVMAAEHNLATKSQLEADFADYYGNNPDLLDAHLNAAILLNQHGFSVSARFLTEFVRWLSTYWELVPMLADVYSDVLVNAGPDFKINNNTSSVLTRWLSERGVDVTRRACRLDGESDD